MDKEVAKAIDLVGRSIDLGSRVLTGAELIAPGLISPLRPDRSLRAALGPARADRLLRTVLALKNWGPTPAAGIAACAARFPKQTMIEDEAGAITFSHVDQATTALASGLSYEGVATGDSIAVLCRNHRYFIYATLAASKLGANAIYLNTSFSGPQIAAVVKREKPIALIYDQEFESVVRAASKDLMRYVAWYDEGDFADPTVAGLISRSSNRPIRPPFDPGRSVIMTSGTTGAPKGAERSNPDSIGPILSLTRRIPVRPRDRTLIIAPAFHAWGFAHVTLGLGLASTMILRRHFDAERTLAAIQLYQPRTLIAVPVMLQRLLELPPEIRRRYDTSSLEIVAVSGSALTGGMATRFMDAFGDTLYNLYGSTEVGWGAIATPEDLRKFPDTAGLPPSGTTIKIFDKQDVELAVGQTGRIFVGNDMQFDGYTDGRGKTQIKGLMETGDVGYLDEAGYLFVVGRDDDMIISGGENVYPSEVEELLGRHPKIVDVAVLGVLDTEFGQRLKAVVVKKPGTKLSSQQVKNYVRDNLARFKVPREVKFVTELPRTSTGKVLKREL